MEKSARALARHLTRLSSHLFTALVLISLVYSTHNQDSKSHLTATVRRDISSGTARWITLTHLPDLWFNISRLRSWSNFWANIWAVKFCELYEPMHMEGVCNDELCGGWHFVGPQITSVLDIITLRRPPGCVYTSLLWCLASAAYPANPKTSIQSKYVSLCCMCGLT